jgi:hypothetical protein
MLEVGRGGRPACNGDCDPTGLFVAGRSVRAVEEICKQAANIDRNGDVQGVRPPADYGAAAGCGVCLRVVHEALCLCAHAVGKLHDAFRRRLRYRR